MFLKVKMSSAHLKVYIEPSLFNISDTKELLENWILLSPINYKGIDLQLLVEI